MSPSNPYSFTGINGGLVDWSTLVGQVLPVLSGHRNPVTKDELAVICARMDREYALRRALVAMKNAGERDAALRVVKLILG